MVEGIESCENLTFGVCVTRCPRDGYICRSHESLTISDWTPGASVP